MRDNTWMVLAIVTFALAALTAVAVGAQALKPTSETYSWPGEFVGFNDADRTITVKSRVVGTQAQAELGRFKPGDRIVLTWSGFDTFADAIKDVVRHDPAKKLNEPFTFAVEFVAYEAPRQYVSFKFQVPAGSAQAIKTLKPGEWVTTISRHRPASDSDAITSVNAYSASPSRPTTH